MEKIVFADVAWVLIATALVLMMTPALAFFYGGLVRKKNVLSTMMHCISIMCVVGLLWVVFGYSMAFGPDKGGIIGGLDWAFLRHVGAAPDSFYGTTIPHLLFMAFQMMFAIITPALIVGAFAERIKFSGFIVFIALWAIFIYNPVAHWVWGNGGWLSKDGALETLYLSENIPSLLGMTREEYLDITNRDAMDLTIPADRAGLQAVTAACIRDRWLAFTGSKSRLICIRPSNKTTRDMDPFILPSSLSRPCSALNCWPAAPSHCTAPASPMQRRCNASLSSTLSTGCCLRNISRPEMSRCRS